ncbi:MAG: hypothetical protein WCD37_19725 [Chloroflexia bacterium]
MITIETKATVTADHKLVIEMPDTVEPGEHDVVVVIGQGSFKPANGNTRQEITFSAHDVGPWPENLSLRREDMYGDDGC